MDITKRTFMYMSLLALVFPVKTFASEKPIPLRPPGALPEDGFMSRCNRCQKCVQVCPTRVIFPAAAEYGFTKINTPVIVFKGGYCNSCLKCSRICPTEALRPVTEKTLDIGVAVIKEKDCVAWGWVGCTVCVDKCPLKAVYLNDSKQPVIIPEKCNGCGICQKECPSTSLGRGIKGKGIIVEPRGAGIPPREIS